MRRTGALLAIVAAAMFLLPPAWAQSQDDAGTGADAGDTFETAASVVPRGMYGGRLDAPAGDRHDFYKFFLEEGASLSVAVDIPSPSDPIVLLDPLGVPVDAGTSAVVGASAGSLFAGDPYQVRLAVHRAAVEGEYRLHLRSELTSTTAYSLCFMNCDPVRDAPIEFICGGSPERTRTRVLLVPPAHGDLGNPFGPTVLDYLQATLRGVHNWTAAMDAFAHDYPQYSYLREIKVEIEVFDGVDPVDPAGYDMVIGYVAAGPAFRGVLASCGPAFDFGTVVQSSNRSIALSLFGSSPRAGQILYDFPEVNDLEIVTMHEFGHAFGLGHTTLWHPELGPDLMNSPAPFVYGDGFPAGDGLERTALKCPSSLDLYGLAVLYRWVPSGVWQDTGGRVFLPPDIPYRMYC